MIVRAPGEVNNHNDLTLIESGVACRGKRTDSSGQNTEHFDLAVLRGNMAAHGRADTGDKSTSYI
jgi:hypothetical protein